MARAPQAPSARSILPKAAGPKDPIPTKEEFEAWAQLPVTRWVAGVYEGMAEQNRQSWLKDTWDFGLPPDPIKLAAKKAAAESFRAMFEATYEDHLANA